MPINDINTKESYIVFGTAVNEDYSLQNALYLPAPHTLPSSNQFMVEAERNANGTMMIQQVGRTQYKTEFKWEFLKNTKWWELNRWLAKNGYVFYAKYFNHSEGCVKIQRFYRGNVTNATPSGNVEIIDGLTVPRAYHDCGFSVIDMGEDYVLTVKELAVK